MDKKNIKQIAKPRSPKIKKDYGQAKRNEKYQKEWLKIFMLLLEYKAKHGHVDVPAREKFKKVALGNWVVRQRVIKDKLPKEHRKLLDKAGLTWDPSEDVWNRKFKLLLKFYEKHRHSLVPIDHQKYPELARWVHMQRKNKATGVLPEDKERKLNHLHFVWDVHDYLWQQKFTKFQEFFAENGHFNIPSNATFTSLAAWKNEQIRQYKNGKLSQDYFEQLKDAGFDLSIKQYFEIRITRDKKGKFVSTLPDTIIK